MMRESSDFVCWQNESWWYATCHFSICSLPQTPSVKMLIFGALTRDLVNLNQFCDILVASVHPFCVIFSWLTRNDFKTLQVYQPPTVVASNHPDWQNMLCNWTFLPSFFSSHTSSLFCTAASKISSLISRCILEWSKMVDSSGWRSDLVVLTALFPLMFLLFFQLWPSGTICFMATWLLHILDTFKAEESGAK